MNLFEGFFNPGFLQEALAIGLHQRMPLSVMLQSEDWRPPLDEVTTSVTFLTAPVSLSLLKQGLTLEFWEYI